MSAEENSKLWLALQEMPRPSKTVDFPRTGIDGQPVGQLKIWVLTQEEQMICTAEAEKFCRKHLKDAKKDDLGYESLFTNAVCIEVLFRACRDVDNVQKPAFPTPQKLQQAFTTEEIGVLFQHYLTVQIELGPLVSRMNDSELDALIERLVEGGSTFPLDSLSSELQKLLLITIASRLGRLMKERSSAGSRPAELLPSAPASE